MARRPLDLKDLSDAVGKVHRLHQTGYTKAGQWNLAMACDHLTKAMDMSIDGFPFYPLFPLRLIGRLVFKRVIFKRRKFREGIRGPAEVEPRDGDEPSAVANFARAAARFKDHSGPLQDSPFLGKLSKEEWEQFHTIHASHHLSFLLPK